MLATEADLVLRGGELLLQLNHILVRLQRGVCLYVGEEGAQRAAEHVLGLRLCGGVASGAGTHGGGARGGNALKDALLKSHLPLHRLNEVRDQVIAALQLHLDLTERFVHAISTAHQSVKCRDNE